MEKEHRAELERLRAKLNAMPEPQSRCEHYFSFCDCPNPPQWEAEA